MCDGDIRPREVHAGIQLCDRGVIPFCDLAQKDIGEDRPRELQLGTDSRDVVDGDVATEDGREVEDRAWSGRELVVRHGTVRGTEEDRLVRKLPDAAARTDRLVIDLHVRVLL